MKYVVGLSPDRGGREALALGITLARACGGSLLVCTVIPELWETPSAARIDAEYGAFLRQKARRALARAKAKVPGDIAAEFSTVAAPSAREGLLKAAAGADCLVLGSAIQARLGRFAQGSVTNSLLHSADLPVAVAPRGYKDKGSARLGRLSIAYSGTARATSVPARAAVLAQAFDIPMRLVTVVVRDKQMYPSGAGYDAENIVANTLREQASAAQEALIAEWRRPIPLTGVIADGKSWKAALDALDWAETELLVVGSSELGALMRVFVGSNSTKILQNAPVPCLVLPRLEG